ncbi:MAG: hypothetical protein Kow0029_21820 [Candidatus Rifleibacteriota bacterium]
MSRATVYLARFAYAVLFPSYLLWHVFFSQAQYRRADLIDSYREKMDISLDIMVNLHSDKSFFHALFLKNFTAIDRKDFSMECLSRKIEAFHNLFPGTLKFIVWNKDGSINSRLTKEKRYQYVLKSMYQLLGEIHSHFAAKGKSGIDKLKTVEQKIKLVRGYFGQFLLPELMINFFKNPYLGEIITVSEKPDRHKLWMYHGKNFSLACFIHKKILNKRTGPELLVRNHNRKSDSIKLGYITPVDYKFSGLPEELSANSELKLEAIKFAQNAISFRESSRFLVFLRQVSADLIAVSYLEKAKVLPDPVEVANQNLILVLKWGAILGFVFYCFLLRFPELFLSVQHKFLLLFLFANGLPALILVSTGYEYFNEIKEGMIEKEQHESIRILKEFDSGFPLARGIYANKLNTFLDRKIAEFGNKPWNQRALDELKSLAENLEVSKAILIDKNKRRYLDYQQAAEFEEDSFFRDYLVRSLDFLNCSDVGRTADSTKSTIESISSEDLIYFQFLYDLNRVIRQNLGEISTWAYIKPIGDYRNFNSWGILGVIWTTEGLMKSYFNSNLKSLEKGIFPRKVALMDNRSEKITPAIYAGNAKLKRLLHQTITRKLVLESNLTIDNKKYLLCALAGREIEDGVLMVIYPRELIEAKISRLKAGLFFIGLCVFLVLTKIVSLFSNRLLTPVKGLANGIEEIRKQNFGYRVDFASDDEFGQLINAFNSTMESLQELAIGTAVQEGLLPEEHYQNRKIKIFARSVFMTKMGGDYYDYFPTTQEKLAVIFGDVAGHGIPAAMIMAMIKAVIVSNAGKFPGPGKLLEKANSVLLHLKERKLRRMMTCQCFEIDCENGTVVFANAGHCYPVVVARSGESDRFIELIGAPLGNRIRKPVAETTIQLEPGDTMILYTDGIVEATNEKGEAFDYARFRDLLMKAWNEDLEKYWEGIMNGYRAWASEQDDDLTFMIIRYDGDE